MQWFFSQKMGWATFWTTFSQTHLVTLVPMCQSVVIRHVVGRLVDVVPPERLLDIEIYELECLVKKWTIFLVKQGKYKVGVVSADRLCCSLLKTIFMYLFNGVV
jgi:hypothetical protein